MKTTKLLYKNLSKLDDETNKNFRAQNVISMNNNSVGFFVRNI